MVELVVSKRVKFPAGKQREFILSSEKVLNFNDNKLAELLKVSSRTIRDWKREKFLMSHSALRILIKKTNVSFPQGIVVKDPYWYTSNGGFVGGLALVRKQGCVIQDEEYRKKKWYQWWNNVGKFKKHPIINICKSIVRPRYSQELAEFVGIVMGDGGLTQNQLVITLHCIDDFEYSTFVVKLLHKLFGVNPSKTRRLKSNVFSIRISRVKLISFCKSIGLVVGDKIKNQIDIPDWIKKSSHYKIACLRGLMDTDGCVVIHKYISNNKQYIYKKLAFTSRSMPLLRSVCSIFEDLGLKHRIGNNSDVRVEAVQNVKRYFEVVGTHNYKHLKRYLI